MRYNRKNMRLEGFDYSSPGSYFITICTKNRHKILCDIVGGGALDAPHFPPHRFQRGVEGAAPYDSNFIFYEMV